MKKFAWTLLYLYLALLGLGIYLYTNSSKAVSGVSNSTDTWENIIPRKDQKQIEYLFRELIIYGSAGYTLFGDKPLSFEVILKPIFKWDLSFLWSAYTPPHSKMRKAWATFQKYQHLFSQREFVIWSEPSPWRKDVDIILIANKKKLDQMFLENQADFQKVLHRKIVNAESLLEEAQIKPLFKEILQSHDGLIGTLLGYGRHNAWLFFDRRKMENKIFKSAFEKEASALFEQKKACLNFVFGWPKLPLADILMYPVFMADLESNETKLLKEKYLETREHIINYYKGGDFLKKTLDQFCL